MKWRPRRAWATVSLLVGMFVAPGAVRCGRHPGESCSLRDPRINESSALVDLGSTWVTTNDSGDSCPALRGEPAHRQGPSASPTSTPPSSTSRRWRPPAPAHVWVGDIGDNAGERKSISVYRVRGRARADRRQPAGATASSTRRAGPTPSRIFVDRQGRLNVDHEGHRRRGRLPAPAQLSTTRPNRLDGGRQRGRVRHRRRPDPRRTTRDRARAVRSPASTRCRASSGSASFPLPPQPQGEGISVGPDGAGPGEQRGRTHSAYARSPCRLPSQRRSTPQPPGPDAVCQPQPQPERECVALAQSVAFPQRNPERPLFDHPGLWGESSGGFGDIDPPWLMWCIPAVIALGALGIGIGLRRAEDRMRLTVVQGDITAQEVDAVVNAANRAMRGGGGVDGAIHRAGGPAVLEDCKRRFPDGLATGQAGWTTAGRDGGAVGDPRGRAQLHRRGAGPVPAHLLLQQRPRRRRRARGPHDRLPAGLGRASTAGRRTMRSRPPSRR